MGKRKIRIKKSASESISSISFYIESKGLAKTAEKFSDSVYDFIEKLNSEFINHRLCREKNRAALGLKCVNFQKRYTIVFFENEKEIIITEFRPSKLIFW
ncbi:hypothetical protein EGI26_03320 [Lacihabitans sp. CCS-44]|nr:hypothetical protein [Lacihabitans sp. CCS-44]